jgi:hypothetical protein
MTDDTIIFENVVHPPVLTAEEARLLLDHLDNVQAAGLLGEKWDVWVAAKKKLVFIEYDGTRDG